MKTIQQTEVFERWIDGQNKEALKNIVRAIHKLEREIMSHTKSIGGGLFELKIHFARGI